MGIGVRGMGILEWRYGLVIGGSGYFESGLQHSPAPESCATQPRRTVSDDCSYSTPRTPWAVICDDIVCLTIRYHENDTLASKTAFNLPKNLSTKTRIFGCIYSGKFGTEVTASVMGSCPHPNMVTPQRVISEMTVSKS